MRVSLQMNPPVTVAAAVEIAVAAEEAGYDTMWFASGRAADVLVVLAAAARETTRIGLGTSVLPIWMRHPYITYQQAMSIQEIAGGRFRLGLGVSHRFFVRFFGYGYERPVQGLTEYATIIRSLVDTGRAALSGDFFSADIESGLSRELELPLYLAGLAPRMAELAGRLADGILVAMAPAEHIGAEVLPALERGAAAAGRPRPAIAALVPTSLAVSPEEALEQVSERFGFYTSVPAYAKLFAGADDTGKACWSPSSLERIALFGGPERVAARLEAYSQSGVGELVVMPSHDPTPAHLRAYRALFPASAAGAAPAG